VTCFIPLDSSVLVTRTCEQVDYTITSLSFANEPSYGKKIALHQVLHTLQGMLLLCWLKPWAFLELKAKKSIAKSSRML